MATDAPRPLRDEEQRDLGDLRAFGNPGEVEAIDTALARLNHLEQTAKQLARDILSLADDAGMPDSYKQTDSRMVRARAALADANPEDTDGDV